MFDFLNKTTWVILTMLVGHLLTWEPYNIRSAGLLAADILYRIDQACYVCLFIAKKG